MNKPAFNMRQLLRLGIGRWFVPRYELNKAEARIKKLENELCGLYDRLRETATLKTNAEQAIRDAHQQEQRATFAIEEAQRKLRKAEKTADAALEECRQQTELNAELLQQGFGLTVDAEAHSALVDASRVQVLTQVTARKLDVRGGLVAALLNPFALNVARHLARKLHGAGVLTLGRDINATRVLLEAGQAALPAKSLD